MKTIYALSLFLFLVPIGVFADTSASTTFNVRNYGAVGDGVALDTNSINRAIDAASAVGGGTVEFPAGSYLSTSIHLKSNITLYLDQGSTIVAATPGPGVAYDAPEDNPTAANFQDFGHTHFQNSLIWGDGLHDVAILGPGTIWGKGLVHDETHDGISGNKSICLKLCRHVILRDFTIQHGGWFGILATGVDNFTIENLKIDTNRDGMDIDCCRDVHILDCTVNSPNDDGICLKSSYGLGYAKPTQDVTIANCTVSGFQEGSVLDNTYKIRNGGMGRIKFGTESNGGFINITITNCVFEHCCGLALESVDGALLQDVSISNITMRDVWNAPIFLRLGERMRGPAGTPVGELDRVNINNVVVYNADPKTGCIISGVPGHDIQDVTLSNIQIWYRGGVSPAKVTPTPPEQETNYPDPGMWPTMPSYGMYIRHVNGITLDNVQFHTLAPDSRPPFVLSDVTGVRVRDTDGVLVPGQ